MFAFVLSTSAFAYEMSDPMQNYTLELMIVKTCSSDRGGIVIAQVETATAIIISWWCCFGVSFSVPAIFAAVCLVKWLLSARAHKDERRRKSARRRENRMQFLCIISISIVLPNRALQLQSPFIVSSAHRRSQPHFQSGKLVQK